MVRVAGGIITQVGADVCGGKTRFVGVPAKQPDYNSSRCRISSWRGSPGVLVIRFPSCRGVGTQADAERALLRIGIAENFDTILRIHGDALHDRVIGRNDDHVLTGPLCQLVILYVISA